MGFYDSMVPKKQDWKCWNCGRALDKDMDIKKQVFQTKELGEHMRVHKEGGKIMLRSSEIECSLGNGFIIVYDYCDMGLGYDGCNKMNYFKLIVKNGFWIATMQMNKAMQKRWNR